jgi:hypothetical protein
MGRAGIGLRIKPDAIGLDADVHLLTEDAHRHPASLTVEEFASR